MLLYSAALFFVLSPGVVLTLPSETESKYMIVGVHALIFALIYSLTHKYVSKMINPDAK